MARLDDLAGRLFDYAVTQPEGFTADDACAELFISYSHFVKCVRRLRLILAPDDTINLIADRQGKNERWRYRLVGTLAESMWWGTNRRKDGLSRLQTMKAVNHSILTSTDGRTMEGRRARVIDKGLSRLIEDLEELDVEAS